MTAQVKNCSTSPALILAGAHSYFVQSFKREGKTSYRDLISNPLTQYYRSIYSTPADTIILRSARRCVTGFHK